MNHSSQLVEFIINHDNTTTFPEQVTFVNKKDNPYFTVQYNQKGAQTQPEPKIVPFTYSSIAEFENVEALFQQFVAIQHALENQKTQFKQYRLEDSLKHKFITRNTESHNTQFTRFLQAVEHEKASRDIYQAAENILLSKEKIRSRIANQVNDISDVACDIKNIANELAQRYTPRMRRRGALTLDNNLIYKLIQ